MHKNLDEKLVQTFPFLYIDRHKSIKESNMGWGFECGDGWYDILYQLSTKLEPLIAKMSHHSKIDCPLPRAIQVKEKFGTLRFYLNHATDKMYNIVLNAEKKSAFVCEQCGNSGKIRDGSWLRTLCDKCCIIFDINYGVDL